jgi:hypothetical protein
MVTKDQIASRLDALKIDYDAAAKKDDLVALLPEGEMERLEAGKGETIACVILRDFWDESGNRRPAGETYAATLEEALTGIETGALRRLK